MPLVTIQALYGDSTATVFTDSARNGDFAAGRHRTTLFRELLILQSGVW